MFINMRKDQGTAIYSSKKQTNKNKNLLSCTIDCKILKTKKCTTQFKRQQTAPLSEGLTDWLVGVEVYLIDAACVAREFVKHAA